MQQLDRSVLLFFLVTFQMFIATVVLVGLTDKKLMIYVTDVYATVSASSADPAISNKMLSCVTQMFSNICLSCVCGLSQTILSPSLALYSSAIKQ